MTTRIPNWTVCIVAAAALAAAGCGGGETVECPGCSIDGVCYGAGQVNPANPCQLCDTIESASAWSDNDGAPCDDGSFCTDGDACLAGACEPGAARDCGDGIACNGDETCNEDTDACDPGAGTCADHEICDVATDACVATCGGCVIDDLCYADGAANPANPCEACLAGVSTTDWSDDDGASCDDGSFCTDGDVCSAGACVAGGARDCGDGIACNGDETCNEDTDSCDAGATTCADYEVCDVATDACVATCTGCIIDAICYPDGMANPANPCQACAVATAVTGWSDNDGASCEDGSFCTDGDTCSAGACVGGGARDCGDGIACNGDETCNEDTDSCDAGATTCADYEVCDVTADACVATCTGCVIGGSCYGAGQLNPANGCTHCDPATSRSDWTNNDGASCDDGSFCTIGDACSGGSCAAGTARDCGDGVACNGVETCDATAGACVAGTPTCSGGEVCDVAADACVVTCTGCVIGGLCYGDGQLSAANPCQACVPATSTTSWSAVTGAACSFWMGRVCAGDSDCAPGGLVCDSSVGGTRTVNTCPTGSNAATQIRYAAPIGNSFLAPGQHLVSIQPGIDDMNSSYDDHTFTSRLHEGSGVGGTMLRQVESPYLADGSTSITIDYSGVELTMGAPYTVVLTNDTPRWASRARTPGAYPDGIAYVSGSASTTRDHCFVVTAVRDNECRAPAAAPCGSADECVGGTTCTGGSCI